MLESLKYFVRNYEELPFDIRLLIWENAFPHTILRCKECKCAILQIDYNGMFINFENYYLFDDNYICFKCCEFSSQFHQ